MAQVGIRSRGDGSRSEEKPGLKIDFNKYVPSQEYYGYKTLVIDNLTQDASMLRERLAFLVFEAMGIASPRNAHARLTVNGRVLGAVRARRAGQQAVPQEPPGRGERHALRLRVARVLRLPLARRRSRRVRAAAVPARDERGPRGRRGRAWWPSSQAINETPLAGYAAAIGSRIDVDRFLTHVAVENAIAEGDGVVGDQGLNNFYLYEYGQKNRFVFIPWDKDNTFTSGSWPLYRNLDKNVLTARLSADPAKRQVYADAVARATTNFVNPRWLTPQLETAYQQIRAAALADARKPFSNGEFEAAVDGLRGVIAAREHDVNAQR